MIRQVPLGAPSTWPQSTARFPMRIPVLARRTAVWAGSMKPESTATDTRSTAPWPSTSPTRNTDRRARYRLRAAALPANSTYPITGCGTTTAIPQSVQLHGWRWRRMGSLSREPQAGPRTDHGTHTRYGALRSGGIRRTTQEGEKLEEFPLILKELCAAQCIR